MTLLDEVTFRHPVSRINNCDHSIEFYRKLGFKLVNEENAIAGFSTKQKNARFVTGESPAPDTHAVEGTKKVNKIVVKIPNADGMATILGNGIAVERLFKGKNGYAFEILSPEDDLFPLHSEDGIQQLTEVDSVNFPKNDELKEVFDFSFENMTLDVANEIAARAFYSDVFEGQFPLDIQFVQAQGADLAVSPLETWDVKTLEYQIPDNHDLKALASFLESKGQAVCLDKRTSVLVLSDPDNIGIWFIK